MRILGIFLAAAVSLAFIDGCGGSGGGGAGTELKRIPLDDSSEIISGYGVVTDREITSDGNGALRITTATPTTVRLFQLADIDIEDAFLVYQARLRTEDFQGEAYLEMLCRFPGKGEYFSRGLDSVLSGTEGWTTVTTRFRCEKGQNPDLVKLNLVAYGTGTVWIDDIRLLKAPLVR